MSDSPGSPVLGGQGSLLPQPASIGAWVLACRPQTLGVGVAPVIVGVACAAAVGRVAWWPTALALVTTVLLQIGSNLANDVFDFKKGADTPDRLGPPRAVALHLLTEQAVKRGLFVVFGTALLLGAVLASIRGPVIVAIGVAAIVTAMAYTAGPYPLAYHGLGEVAVFVFFGLVAVTGAAFVASGRWYGFSLVAAVPVGALSVCVLLVNNIRDVDNDARAGKRTIVVRFGKGFGVALYRVLVIASVAIPCACAVYLRSPFLALPLGTLTLLLTLFKEIETLPPRQLNPLLKRTAISVVLVAVTWAVGIRLEATAVARRLAINEQARCKGVSVSNA